MKNVEISDELYAKVASRAGSDQVAHFVAEAIREYLVEDKFDPKMFFTAERLAEIDRASRAAKAGAAAPLDAALERLYEIQGEWQQKAG